MDVNIKSLKDKSSKYQASSKLINDSTIWKSTSTQESYEPKKKGQTRSHWNGIPNNWKSKKSKFKVNSIWQWKKGTNFIVGDSMLAGIAQKRISGSRSIKACIFPGATTHGIYNYLKPLLTKNPANINLHIGTNNSVILYQI